MLSDLREGAATCPLPPQLSASERPVPLPSAQLAAQERDKSVKSGTNGEDANAADVAGGKGKSCDGDDDSIGDEGEKVGGGAGGAQDAVMAAAAASAGEKAADVEGHKDKRDGGGGGSSSSVTC